MPTFHLTENTTKADIIAWNMEHNLDLYIKANAFYRPDVEMVFNTELDAELPTVPTLTTRQRQIAEIRREALEILELLEGTSDLSEEITSSEQYMGYPVGYTGPVLNL